VLAAALFFAVLGVIGSGGVGLGDESPSPVESATPEPTASPRPTPDPTPRPTSTPPPGPQAAALGEPVRIICEGTDCLDITVSNPSFNAQYYDPNGFYNDVPETAGNLFLQVYVEYAALDDGVFYNALDWALYANDQQVPYQAFAIHGPKPELGSGQLDTGRTAAGWILWEVPPSGTVEIAYAPNFEGPAIFLVTLR
jgi:hypothetical protein